MGEICEFFQPEQYHKTPTALLWLSWRQWWIWGFFLVGLRLQSQLSAQFFHLFFRQFYQIVDIFWKMGGGIFQKMSLIVIKIIESTSKATDDRFPNTNYQFQHHLIKIEINWSTLTNQFFNRYWFVSRSTSTKLTLTPIDLFQQQFQYQLICFNKSTINQLQH